MAVNEPVRRRGRRRGRWWAISGIVCGVLSLLFPVIFAPLGIALGAVGYGRGDKTLGTVALVISNVGLVIFLVLFISELVSNATSMAPP